METPLALGVLAARYLSYIHYLSIALVFFCLLPCLILCGQNYYLWLMTPVVVILMGIAFVKLIPFFVWENVKVIGDISLYILIVHPIVKEVILPIFVYWDCCGMIVYASVMLVISLLVAKSVAFFKNKNVKFGNYIFFIYFCTQKHRRL